jgi:hypothetical protein
MCSKSSFFTSKSSFFTSTSSLQYNFLPGGQRQVVSIAKCIIALLIHALLVLVGAYVTYYTGQLRCKDNCFRF